MPPERENGEDMMYRQAPNIAFDERDSVGGFLFNLPALLDFRRDSTLIQLGFVHRTRSAYRWKAVPASPDGVVDR